MSFKVNLLYLYIRTLLTQTYNEMVVLKERYSPPADDSWLNRTPAFLYLRLYGFLNLLTVLRVRSAQTKHDTFTPVSLQNMYVQCHSYILCKCINFYQCIIIVINPIYRLIYKVSFAVLNAVDSDQISSRTCEEHFARGQSRL